MPEAERHAYGIGAIRQWLGQIAITPQRLRRPSDAEAMLWLADLEAVPSTPTCRAQAPRWESRAKQRGARE